MKHFLSFIAILFAAISSIAQDSELLSYQVTVRDGTGNLLNQKPLGTRISSLQKTDGSVSLYIGNPYATSQKITS